MTLSSRELRRIELAYYAKEQGGYAVAFADLQDMIDMPEADIRAGLAQQGLTVTG